MKTRTVPQPREMTGPADPASSTRRDFLRRMGLLGGGLIVYAAVSDLPTLARAAREGYAGAKVPVDFNAFLRIGADDRVTCFVGKIEMGQGPITSFAQVAAEELDVPYEAVDLVMGDTDLCPWDGRHLGIPFDQVLRDVRQGSGGRGQGCSQGDGRRAAEMPPGEAGDPGRSCL